jgi:hypothetical protein
MLNCIFPPPARLIRDPQAPWFAAAQIIGTRTEGNITQYSVGRSYRLCAGRIQISKLGTLRIEIHVFSFSMEKIARHRLSFPRTRNRDYG